MTGAWWTRAEPGDKVVCVDDRMHIYDVPGVVAIGTLDGLTAGVVYTIRTVGPSPNPNHAGQIVVRLTEINRPLWLFGEDGYHPNRFRPVERDRTERSMAILNKLLVPARSTTDA